MNTPRVRVRLKAVQMNTPIVSYDYNEYSQSVMTTTVTTMNTPIVSYDYNSDFNDYNEYSYNQL